MAISTEVTALAAISWESTALSPISGSPIAFAATSRSVPTESVPRSSLVIAPSGSFADPTALFASSGVPTASGLSWGSDTSR